MIHLKKWFFQEYNPCHSLNMHVIRYEWSRLLKLPANASASHWSLPVEVAGEPGEATGSENVWKQEVHAIELILIWALIKDK